MQTEQTPESINQKTIETPKDIQNRPDSTDHDLKEFEAVTDFIFRLLKDDDADQVDTKGIVITITTKKRTITIRIGKNE